jgi:N-acetylglucosaminyldiphosphoundecaprenol N-acetyl-beta-D-mannosaminyltransferase
MAMIGSVTQTIPLPAMETAPACFQVLGVRVDAVQIEDVIARMEGWILTRQKPHTIAVTGMHGVAEANRDPEIRRVLKASSLVVPDGMPLVWLGRWHGYDLQRRVYGPELMLEFCEQTQAKGYRHFFYGGAPGVAERLADTLAKRFPELIVAGTFCPPFRPLTPSEAEEVIGTIRAAAPDVLWVGMSTPKQEKWMQQFREPLGVPVMVGSGAAFDLNTGRVSQAPRWMREHGLEWLFRLLAEPRRLWRRYLLRGPEFVWNVALELLRIRKF